MVVGHKSAPLVTLYVSVFCLFYSLAEANPSPEPSNISTSRSTTPSYDIAEDGLVHPDQFRLQQDGNDDAPSINRAISFLVRSRRNQLDFLPHPYLLKSSVVQRDVSLHWRGQGWSEPAGGAFDTQSLGVGTWLVIDRLGFTPVTIAGSGARGTIIDDLAVVEKQPVAPAGKQWQPAPYPYAFAVEGTFGSVSFRHIMLLAVTKGINAHLSGRLEIKGLYGQVFDNAVKVDKAYDADIYDNIHFWPFWSQANPVMTYVQSHFDVLWLQRADTGFINNMFIFGARSALRLDQSESESSSVPGGPATKNTVGALPCDATRWCIWITGFNVHFQAASIDSQSQEWTGPGTSAVAMKGAAAIRIEGQAVAQVGRVWQEFTDHSTLSYLNTRAASNVQVGSLYEDLSHADQHPAHVTMNTTTSGQSMLFLAAPPMVVTRPDQVVTDGTLHTNGVVRVP